MKHEVCATGVCVCPTCGVAEVLLHSSLRYQGATPDELTRVRVVGYDFAGASHPYLASVKVDGREVYRIMSRVQEVLEPDVQDDVIAALRRQPCS